MGSSLIISEGKGRIRIMHSEGGRFKTSNTGQTTSEPYEFRISFVLSQASKVYVLFGDGSSKSYFGTEIAISKVYPDNAPKITDIYFADPTLLTEANFALDQVDVVGYNKISNNGNSIDSIQFLNTTVHSVFKVFRCLGGITASIKVLNLPSSIETFFSGSSVGKPLDDNFDSLLASKSSLKHVKLGDVSGNPYVVNWPFCFEAEQSVLDLNNWPDLETLHIREGQPGLSTLLLNSKLRDLILGGSPIINMDRLPDSVYRFNSGLSLNLDFDSKTISDYMPNTIMSGFYLNLNNIAVGKSIGSFVYPGNSFTFVGLVNVGVTEINCKTRVLYAPNNVGLASITIDEQYINACNISGNASLTSFVHGEIIGDGGFAILSDCPLLNSVINVTTQPNVGTTYYLANIGLDKATLIAQIGHIYANRKVKNSGIGKSTFELTGISNASLVQPSDGVYPADDAQANALFGFVRGGGALSNGNAGSGDNVTVPVDGSPSNAFEQMYVLVNQCQTNGFHRYGANFLYNS